MPAPLAAAGYRGIVQMLANASRGSYRGPAVPVDAVSRALSSTEGLDPGQLVEHTRAAVGMSSTSGVRGEIIESLFTFLSQAAFGEILGRVADNISDWFANRDDSEEITRDAEDAGEALRDIDNVADTGVDEILIALRAVITQLCAFLNQVDPANHPREFAECVAAGADLIDSAGSTILDCCRDRDTAVASCLDEFIARGTTVCEKPASCARTNVVCDEGTPGAPSGEGKPTQTSTIPQSVEPRSEPPVPPKKPMEEPTVPTAPQSVEPRSEPPVPPKKPMEEPTVPTAPQSVEPVVECQPTPETPEVPETAEPDGTDCCGILGLVGAGAAILGIGLLISSLEDCMPEPAPEPAPEPVTEPAPEPVPEPPPPPKQNLADVPEPPPPPKQTAVPVAVLPVVPEPQLTPVQGGARKAGEW